MLTNKDFANLLAQPEKVRFDLKQISTWDKQNEAKFNKKSKPSKAKSSKGDSHEDEDGETPKEREGKYRDRALERRKDIKDEKQAEMDDMVKKLDAEQTKYLGGDIEHTHLVKGLDYALLRKIRDDKQGSANLWGDKGSNPQSEMLVEIESVAAKKELVTSTSLGESLKSFLARTSTLSGGGDSSVAVHGKGAKLPAAQTSAGLLLSHMIFEFDVTPDSEVELPTTISTSRQVCL